MAARSFFLIGHNASRQTAGLVLGFFGRGYVGGDAAHAAGIAGPVVHRKLDRQIRVNAVPVRNPLFDLLRTSFPQYVAIVSTKLAGRLSRQDRFVCPATNRLVLHTEELLETGVDENIAPMVSLKYTTAGVYLRMPLISLVLSWN